jgi:hypothetical protein
VFAFAGTVEIHHLVAAFSPDGRLLAAPVMYLPAKGTTVRLWDLDTGRPVRRFPQQNAVAGAVAFSRDGKRLAVAERRGVAGGTRSEGTIRAYALGGGRELWRERQEHWQITSLTFSPEDRLLAVCHDGGMDLLDAATGRSHRRVELRAHYVGPVTFAPDGRTLAFAWWPEEGVDYSVRLLEVASGTVRSAWRGHEGAVTALAFSPDGRTLASGSTDATVLLWDATNRTPSVAAPPPTAEQLKALWSELAAEDAAAAFKAMRRLAAAPAEAVPFLKQRIHPVPRKPVDARTVTRLITDLDDNRFKVREKATRELEALGAPVVPALRKTLAGKPDLDVQRRIERLLAKLDPPSPTPHLLRSLRALEVLEWIGTPDARKMVQAVADGDPWAELTRAAQQVLRCMR